MTDIARIVIFKKENGEEFTFDDKYVQLTSLEKRYIKRRSRIFQHIQHL